MNVSGLVAHLADNNLVLFVTPGTLFADFTVRAFPLEPLHEVALQWRGVTLTMQGLFAARALEHIINLSDSSHTFVTHAAPVN